MDFKKRQVLFSTDTFKTKPIFYAEGNKNLGCASYKAALSELGHNNIKKMNLIYPGNKININRIKQMKYNVMGDERIAPVRQRAG